MFYHIYYFHTCSYSIIEGSILYSNYVLVYLNVIIYFICSSIYILPSTNYHKNLLRGKISQFLFFKSFNPSRYVQPYWVRSINRKIHTVIKLLVIYMII